MKYIFGYRYSNGGGKRTYTANSRKEAEKMMENYLKNLFNEYRPGTRYELWFEVTETEYLNQIDMKEA